MDGDWSSEDLPLFVKLVLRNRRHLPLDTPLTKALNVGNDLWHRLRANTRSGSRRNIRYHYDLSNDLFSLFLDETMTYSSAVFAQEGQSSPRRSATKFRRLAERRTSYLATCEGAFETRSLGQPAARPQPGPNRALPGNSRRDRESGMRGFLRRRVADPLLLLLKQGLTPETLALSLALGASLGLFPVLGATTALCVAAGLALRLSHPALQVANYVVYPLQVPLILVFVRIGERIVGAAPMPFSVERLLVFFREDPLAFLERFGWTGLHGILGWLTVAPLVGGALYAGLVPLLRHAARRVAPTAEPAA